MRGTVLGPSPPLVVDLGDGHVLVPKQLLYFADVFASIKKKVVQPGVCSFVNERQRERAVLSGEPRFGSMWVTTPTWSESWPTTTSLRRRSRMSWNT